MESVNFVPFLTKDLIFVGKNFTRAEDVVTFLAGQLLKRDYVKRDFLDSILEREKIYPTGLNLGSVNVAIPHTDAKFVVRQTIAVATLKKPVLFGRMDNPNEKIPVHIVLLLAVNDRENYTKFLSKLISELSNQNFVKSIYCCGTKKELTGLLWNCLKPEGGDELQGNN